MGMPIKDLDFVLEGDAPSLAARLAEEMDGRLLVHPSFGTASVVIEDATTDLVTARLLPKLDIRFFVAVHLG